MFSVNLAILFICLACFFLIEKRLQNTNRKEKYKTDGNYALLTVLFGIITGRIVFVLANLEYYKDEPVNMLNLADRDMSMYGSLLGAILFTVLYTYGLQISRSLFVKRIILIFLLTFAFTGATNIYHYVRTDIYIVQNEATLTPFQNKEDIDVKKPRIINYWATWCPPCIREMPRLIDAANTHSDNIEFMFVNQFQNPLEIKEFEKRYNLRIPYLVINDGLDEQLNRFGEALPTTIFLDKSDKVIYQHVGEISNATLHKKIRDLLQ